MLNKPIKETLTGIMLAGVTILLLPFGATGSSSSTVEPAPPPPPSLESCTGPKALKVSTDCYASLLSEGKLPKSQQVIENAVKELLESSPQVQQLACSLPERKIDITGSIMNQGKIENTGLPAYMLRTTATNEYLQNPDWDTVNGLEPQEGAQGLTDAQAAILDNLLAPQVEERLQAGGDLWPSVISLHEVGSILWESNSGDLLYTKAFAEKDETGKFELRLDPPINRTGLGPVDPADANVHTVTCSE